jgi:hypothetical protein
MSGHDFWRGVEPQYHLRGRYVTDLLTEESVRQIKAAATADAPPLFLVLAHQAPHAGNPGDHDLEYHEGDLDRFIHIADERRRKYAGNYNPLVSLVHARLLVLNFQFSLNWLREANVAPPITLSANEVKAESLILN